MEDIGLWCRRPYGRSLEIIGARYGAKRRISLELRASQVRMARKRLAKVGREGVAYLLLQRIWRSAKKVIDGMRTGATGSLMRNILKRANPEWREQRSVEAQVFDPRNSE